jgi:hypothetical protein
MVHAFLVVETLRAMFLMPHLFVVFVVFVVPARTLPSESTRWRGYSDSDGWLLPMPILVDGHNLIGQLEHIKLSDAEDEAELVLLLRRYAARKAGRRIEVVFDGGVYGHPHNLNGYGVRCLFAQKPGDADRELIRKIHSIRRKDAWLVVTSDKRVAGEARAHNIRVESAQSFAAKLTQQQPEVPRVRTEDHQKERKLSAYEIEEWLRLFGAEDELSEE